MDRVELRVHFQCEEADGSYLFLFPCGERIQVTENDVERSLPLRDMLGSAVNCGETTITFPCSVELSHFHIWAAAVHPDSPVFQTDAEGMKRALEAADVFADGGLMQRLAAAYDVQLFPADTVAPDADFLRVLEGMRGELASTVLGASSSSRPVGERACLLPERLHPLDEAIAAVSAAAESQRATPEGQRGGRPMGSACIEEVAASPDGRWFATCGEQRPLEVWHTATFSLVRTLQGPRVEGLAWSPDSRLLASGSSDGPVTVWNVATGAVTASLGGHDGGSVEAGSTSHVRPVAWSPDGLKLCTTANRAGPSIWELATGKAVHVLEGLDDLELLAWSPDGTCVAMGETRAGTVHVWDVATGGCVRSLEKFKNRIVCAAWSPCGGMLASVSGESVCVWDVATGTAPKHTLRIPVAWVESVAWCPDGRRLATNCYLGSDDVTVWEVETGTSMRVQTAGLNVWSIAWGSCGSLLFAATDTGLHIYNV